MEPLLWGLTDNQRWYLGVGTLCVAAVVLLPVAFRVLRDVKGVEEETSTPQELLGPLEQAYAAGQMSDEEYQKIKHSVVRSAVPDVPAKPRLSEQPPGPDSPTL
jgi:hypothetical protein